MENINNQFFVVSGDHHLNPSFFICTLKLSRDSFHYLLTTVFRFFKRPKTGSSDSPTTVVSGLSPQIAFHFGWNLFNLYSMDTPSVHYTTTTYITEPRVVLSHPNSMWRVTLVLDTLYLTGPYYTLYSYNQRILVDLPGPSLSLRVFLLVLSDRCDHFTRHYVKV